MKITLNGEPRDLKGEPTVLDLLTEAGANPEIVAVELNGNILERSVYGETRLNEGDAVEFLHFMGGGGGGADGGDASGGDVSGSSGSSGSSSGSSGAAGTGVAAPVFAFSEDQIQRYSRQIILQEIGGKGQKKLAQAKVLIVGAGGLGSPSSLYLAAAGVGTIGVVDSDVVDLSNLQRQVLHRTEDIGRPKVQSAERTLKAINPDINVITYHTRLGKDNVRELVDQYDVIIDGVDNFPARYLVNDACVFAGKPLVEAGILRFDGMALTITPPEGPCYRCVFPEPPPPGTVPTCQEAGIIGAVAGIMGVVQALETVKLITGAGETLSGRILIVDALSTRFREVKIKKNPRCPVCGENPTITELVEYDLACDLRGAPAGAAD